MTAHLEDDADLRRALRRTLPADLAEAVAAPDDAELDASLRRAWRIVYARVVERGVSNPEDARDVTQEVFVRVLARIATEDAPDAPIVPQYLVRAAEHLMADRWRAQAVRARHVDHGVVAAPSAEEAAMAGFERNDALEALEELPLIQRQVLRLRVIDGLSAEEAGRLLGREAASVRQIQHRALLELRRRLEDRGGPSK
jgi:RNA polymerase sigma-70 factor (ECF subfamily)